MIWSKDLYFADAYRAADEEDPNCFTIGPDRDFVPVYLHTSRGAVELNFGNNQRVVVTRNSGETLVQIYNGDVFAAHEERLHG